MSSSIPVLSQYSPLHTTENAVLTVNHPGTRTCHETQERERQSSGEPYDWFDWERLAADWLLIGI